MYRPLARKCATSLVAHDSPVPSHMEHHKPRLDSINERALEFACRVIDPFLPSLPDRPGVRRIVDQLMGASGGIGANLEEAQAEPRNEFLATRLPTHKAGRSARLQRAPR